MKREPFLKRRRLLFFYLAAALFLIGGLPYRASGEDGSGDGVICRASVDKESAFIGDEIEYSIDVYPAGAGYEVVFPDNAERLGPFEIRRRRVVKSKYPFIDKRRALRLILSAYSAGTHTIPPLTVRYRFKEGEWKEKSTEPLTVEIKSLLSQEPQAKDVKDIKGPVELRQNYLLRFVILILLFVLGALIAAFLIRYIRRRGRNPRICPAHEIAYRELEDIRRRGLIQQGKIKEFYTRLSDCIRRYLENRFFFRTSEMTSEEFLESVKDSAVLSAEHKLLLKDFLSSCDMVKFARYGPAQNEIETSFEKAKSFIDQTKEQLIAPKANGHNPQSGGKGRGNDVQ